MTNEASSGTAVFQVAVPVADLRDRPAGRRVRQLLFGATVIAHGQREGSYFVEARRDGYRGFIDPTHLAPCKTATHKVSAPATHLYAAPDIKSSDLASLCFGSSVTLTEAEGAFWRTDDGAYIPACHVAKEHLRFRDPVAVADLFLGTPYLWGGNSRLGIDCSGLVQAACHACGIDCPGDTDEQVATLGEPLPENADLKRGDLLFWYGHVAMVASPNRLLHANAHHMSVAYEPIAEASHRIAEQGEGPITARRRP